jgi:hypothetical protein
MVAAISTIVYPMVFVLKFDRVITNSPLPLLRIPFQLTKLKYPILSSCSLLRDAGAGSPSVLKVNLHE